MTLPPSLEAADALGWCFQMAVNGYSQLVLQVDFQRIFSWDAGIATAFHNGRKPKERAANMRMAYFDHYKQSGISTKKHRA